MFEANTEPQAGPNWNTVRVVTFWVGATSTAIVSVVLFILVWIISPDSDLVWWYTVNFVAGAPVAYLIGWKGGSRQSVRMLAAMLFIAAAFFSLLPGIMVLHLPGLIGILAGTPHRSKVRRTHRPLP